MERLRTFVKVTAGTDTATVDILRGGRVRLCVGDNPDTALQADTPEELMLLSAAHPQLSSTLYDALL